MSAPIVQFFCPYVRVDWNSEPQFWLEPVGLDLDYPSLYWTESTKNSVPSGVNNKGLICDLIYAHIYLSAQSWDVKIHLNRVRLEFVFQILFPCLVYPFFF